MKGHDARTAGPGGRHRRSWQRPAALLVALTGIAALLMPTTRGGEDAGSAAVAVPSRATPGPLPATTDTASPDGLSSEEDALPSDVAGAVAAAERFAFEWATAGPHWHERVSGLSSESLGASLAGADPLAPAPRLVGPGVVLAGAPRWARIAVPTDRGDVVVDLVATDGGWLVTGVDWWPA